MNQLQGLLVPINIGLVMLLYQNNLLYKIGYNQRLGKHI